MHRQSHRDTGTVHMCSFLHFSACAAQAALASDILDGIVLTEVAVTRSHSPSHSQSRTCGAVGRSQLKFSSLEPSNASLPQ